MKKTFVNPEMNISLFDMENVVTISGGTEPAAPTNAETAKAALTTAGATKIANIDWTF